ncbi:MAG: hypothetical protein ABI785_13785 [Gemmatimonadales bacterium]
MQERRRAGLGGIAFSIALVVGFTIGGPNGGEYGSEHIADFVGRSSIMIIVSTYLLAISMLGLIGLMAYLRHACFGPDGHDRITWGTSLLAVASFLIGWALYLAPSAAINAGGPAIDPGITYAFLSAGLMVVFGASAILLGMSLLRLALAGHAAPMWVRGFSALAGLSSLSSWGFLIAAHWSPNQWLPVPFYLVILWGLALGAWLLASGEN